MAATALGPPPAHPSGRGLAVAALVSWLLAEGLGAYMFRTWLASGRWGRRVGVGQDGDRQRRGWQTGAGQGATSWPLIVGHASLAFAGFVCWISFLVTGAPAVAWVSIGFLAPAIGLGISTVTVWTPYPVRRPVALARASAPPRPRNDPQGTPGILVSNEMLDQILASEALAGKLVDDLVEKLLTPLAEPPPVSRSWQFAPLIPILHGLLAITTFLLAVLAAINAIT